MHSRQRMIDYLVAAAIIIAFGGLFFGRLMLYPVATAPGTFLERVASESNAWDMGHRWMLAGMIAIIPAALGLRRAMLERSPWLADAAAVLAIFGAVLGVGQYALDFAMLAAAGIEPHEAGAQFTSALQANNLVRWAFYKLPDVGQIGMALFAVALWRQGAGWRVPAALVTVAAGAFFLALLVFGAMGVRVALGLTFLGFSTVAWKIAIGPARPSERLA